MVHQFLIFTLWHYSIVLRWDAGETRAVGLDIETCAGKTEVIEIGGG